ncbi:hypothetical protein HJ01_01707 [Flavobacterium frigoris PS1]|uniref:Uncharacterized protein n=1 Tax=Flavobacterium frigoris (strain PS1) TaxID=1086011 RepID=H7FRF9_FLAFP|nr:hypothetical protein HJ01_01707 [Flavobacterium frigoris PS1]
MILKSKSSVNFFMNVILEKDALARIAAKILLSRFFAD